MDHSMKEYERTLRDILVAKNEDKAAFENPKAMKWAAQSRARCVWTWGDKVGCFNRSGGAVWPRTALSTCTRWETWEYM